MSSPSQLFQSSDAELREVIAGMVGGSGQRSGRNHQETFTIGGSFIAFELIGRDETVYPVMFGRGLKVLADGQKVDISAAGHG